MTIDEAIKHCEEVVAECATECKAGHFSQRIKAGKCAEEHRQLAEWLKDYKRLLEQEPSEDYISRQAVLEVIRKCHCEEWVKADIGASIEALSSVTPAEKVGWWEWVQYDGNPNIGNWHCSECHCIVEDGKPSYKYCPQCGCKMQEVEE